MRPHVIMHNATSVDGWIIGFEADIGLYYELASRWDVDAMLAGSGTILAAPGQSPDNEVPGDAAAAGVADEMSRQLLVVPDSRGRVRNWRWWLSAPYWKTIVVLCSTTTPREYLDYLERCGIERIVAGDDHVDLRVALDELNARYGVKTVRIDSGGTLNGVMLRAGLVDEVSVLVHPALVGGTIPRTIFRLPEGLTSEPPITLSLAHVETLRDGIVWLRYHVAR